MQLLLKACRLKCPGNFRYRGIAAQKHFVIERYEIRGFLWAFTGDLKIFSSRENSVVERFRNCGVELW